jgi:prophage maintenance system killer protein
MPQYRITARIERKDLPTPYTIKIINIMFLRNAKRQVKNSSGEQTIYHLHDKTYNQMRKYILNVPDEGIQKIIDNFPFYENIYEQCAYYFRAFSRGQIFLDGNHRTGFFSLSNILKKKSIIINANLNEIVSMTEYMKAKGWIKQGQMNVRLTQRDEEYIFLVEFFKERLELR